MLWGILGGLIWCTGAVLNFIASRANIVGPAVSYSIGQGATMISAAWGVFIWHEFSNRALPRQNLTRLDVCRVSLRALRGCPSPAVLKEGRMIRPRANLAWAGLPLAVLLSNTPAQGAGLSLRSPGWLLVAAILSARLLHPERAPGKADHNPAPRRILINGSRT